MIILKPFLNKSSQFLACFLGLQAATYGAEYRVTTLQDEFNSLPDTGLSLREAFSEAADESIITFDESLNGGSISLELGKLDVSKSVIVDASGLSDGLTITRGEDQDRHKLIDIDDGLRETNLTITLIGLKFVNGDSFTWGGAIECHENLNVFGCTFTGNRTTRQGGAIYLGGIDTAGVIKGNLFSQNFASSGGGIHNDDSSTIVIERCHFLSNTATNGGGAISDQKLAEIDRCLFAGNQGRNGGAISCFTGNLQVSNSSFRGNRATGEGGGIFFVSSFSALTNCSFHGNHGEWGGAISFYSGSLLTLNNCLIWGNHSDYLGDKGYHSVGYFPSKDLDVRNCLIEGLSKASLDSKSELSSGNLEPFDPLWEASIDPTSAPTLEGDLRVGFGSPALDSGLASLLLNKADLLGHFRGLDGTVDIGAYEGTLISFETEFGHLARTGDANGNGLSNFFEYASGFSPTSPGRQQSIRMIGADEMIFHHRSFASDVYLSLQQSPDLNSWGNLIEGWHYEKEYVENFGSRVVTRVTLLNSVFPGNYFRVSYD